MSEVKTFEFNWAGRPLKIEIGEVAKQANGACLVRIWRFCSFISCMLKSV